MATEDKRIDQLPAAGALSKNALLVLQENGEALKMTAQQLLDYIQNNIYIGNAVLFVAQNLTEEQKLQARTNIGAAAPGEGGGNGSSGTDSNAVLYTVQTLTTTQQQQARTNIGAGPSDSVRYGGAQYLTAAEKAQARTNIGAAKEAADNAVLYTAQYLTTTQQQQARTNIGAGPNDSIRYGGTQSLTEGQKRQARTNIGAIGDDMRSEINCRRITINSPDELWYCDIYIDNNGELKHEIGMREIIEEVSE